MINYLARRLLMMIPLLIGITLMTFFIMQLAPGKPTDLVTDLNPKMSSEARDRLVKLYDLDKPWHVRYAKWVKRVARLDFGESFRDGRPVMKKIAERLPATLLLNILSLILIFTAALSIGIYSAVHKDSLFDKISTFFVYVGFSVPTFWVALLLMIGLGLKLGLLPISGLRSIHYGDLSAWGKVWDMARHLVLPVLVTGLTGLAALARYSRSAMLEVIRQDYVRTARAKGLSERDVILKHAFRNALIPIVTLLGLMLPELIGGSFIFETIFAYPGMGRLGYDAIMARDYPVLMGIGTIVALLTLLGNLLADVLYAFADPRIRYQ
ncbi:MAG: diguanylate cyclase [Elusimicrobia bacterium RIFCSPLOWO2_01_FULL_60_11]|nr:MAG: diguanylate cyclase [Elusimicrobia bacterium RIFCSPLOWO2_01_FULL_60_11]